VVTKVQIRKIKKNPSEEFRDSFIAITVVCFCGESNSGPSIFIVIVLTEQYMLTSFTCPFTPQIFSRNNQQMQPCNRIYYSTVHCRLNMFRAAYRSSSEALTVFAASGIHTHVVTGRSQVLVGNQTWLRPVTTCVCKPEAENTVKSPWWQVVCRSKLVEPSMNWGIINYITRLHLVGYLHWVILRCTDPWILKMYKYYWEIFFAPVQSGIIFWSCCIYRYFVLNRRRC
jgi:hypothetical protein